MGFDVLGKNWQIGYLFKEINVLHDLSAILLQYYIQLSIIIINYLSNYTLSFCFTISTNKIITIFQQSYPHPMKQISLISSNTIRNHQTNSSTSKVAYMFSKKPRFAQPNPQCKMVSYSNQSELSRRKAAFGYGDKSDFTKPQTVSPASTKYNHKSFCDDSKNKGKSIGLSRDKIPDRSYLIPQMQRIPGPGNYENQVKTKMIQQYTMRPKTIDVLESRKTYKKAPGPGQYNTIDMQPKNGRFTVAKFSDSKFSIINNSPRFRTIKQSPGPLSYRQGDSLDGKAKYVLSHRRGNGTRAFSRSRRLTFINQANSRSKQLPGPGNYQQPTEFGYYGDAKYYKKTTS